MSRPDKPYIHLKAIFHEPNRLAILCALASSTDGWTFNDLKEECNLTDGNLSRHLKSLEDSKVVRIKKTIARSKPQTTVYLTDRGREKFIEYLQALEEVLRTAALSVASGEEKSDLPIALMKFLRA